VRERERERKIKEHKLIDWDLTGQLKGKRRKNNLTISNRTRPPWAWIM